MKSYCLNCFERMMGEEHVMDGQKEHLDGGYGDRVVRATSRGLFWV